jgi:hypothetical protein
MVAAHLHCEAVLITDGNDKAAHSTPWLVCACRALASLSLTRRNADLSCSLSHNTAMLASHDRGFVRGEKLLWDRQHAIAHPYRHSFDFVLAADWYAALSSQTSARLSAEHTASSRV